VADNRRAGLFDPEVGKKLRPQQSGEGIAVTPEQEQLEDGDHDRRRKTLGGHENVKEQDVHDDRTENRQTKGNEASDEQEQAAEYLQAADYVNVAAGKKHFYKISGQILRNRRHGNEMQKRVRAEHDENESEQVATLLQRKISTRQEMLNFSRALFQPRA